MCVELNCSNPNPDGTPGVVNITGIMLVHAGSGYSSAPVVAILDGTQFDPIRNNPGTGAVAVATLKVTYVTVDTPGSGYTQGTTTVDITDAGLTATALATATATVETGAITAISVDPAINPANNPGSGYLSGSGIKKFTDPLPGLCNPAKGTDPLTGGCPTTGKYIPLAVGTEKDYTGVKADEYVIGLVQYRTNFSSSLPDTLVRGYVQLDLTCTAAGVGNSTSSRLGASASR